MRTGDPQQNLVPTWSAHRVSLDRCGPQTFEEILIGEDKKQEKNSSAEIETAHGTEENFRKYITKIPRDVVSMKHGWDAVRTECSKNEKRPGGG